MQQVPKRSSINHLLVSVPVSRDRGPQCNNNNNNDNNNSSINNIMTYRWRMTWQLIDILKTFQNTTWPRRALVLRFVFDNIDDATRAPYIVESLKKKTYTNNLFIYTLVRLYSFRFQAYMLCAALILYSKYQIEKYHY